MLSNRQQIARLRRLAVQALGAYPLVAPELLFVAHGENTTFRVDAMVAGGPDRFLLRVHRPTRHGRRLDSAAAVGSELDWLTALRADTGLSVPEPVRTTNGKLTTAAASPDVPEPRVCSLLRWMDGRVHSSVPREVAFGLWYAGTAEVNPAFRADLSEVLGDIGHSLDTLLGD